MINDDAFERLLADVLAEGPYHAPSAVVEAAIEEARHRGRFRRWRALVTAGAMDARGASRPGLRTAAVMVTIVIVGALAVALGVGSHVRLPWEPNEMALPTKSPAATEPAPTRFPTPTLLPNGDLPGDPMPDDWLGTWMNTLTRDWYVNLSAGDPFCVDVVGTAQDCDAWLDPEGNLLGYERDTMLDGYNVAVLEAPVTGPCRGVPVPVTLSIEGDTMTWGPVPGACNQLGGRPVPLVRAGTGTAPSAPPWPPPPGAPPG